MLDPVMRCLLGKRNHYARTTVVITLAYTFGIPINFAFGDDLTLRTRREKKVKMLLIGIKTCSKGPKHRTNEHYSQTSQNTFPIDVHTKYVQGIHKLLHHQQH